MLPILLCRLGAQSFRCPRSSNYDFVGVMRTRRHLRLEFLDFARCPERAQKASLPGLTVEMTAHRWQIRIALRSLTVFFNDLALSHVSRKSLKFQSSLLSITTVPTNILRFLEKVASSGTKRPT